MESAYLNDNRRELELTKSISLLRLDPLAPLALRETGLCTVSVPEELFDLDLPGQYFRRIKAVRLSIPCIAGPHTAVSCTLRLIGNTVRVNTSMNSAGEYEHENDEGVWIDDDRFRSSSTPVTALATSTAQSDPGLFELSFRDERYLPFEYAGAISEWAIELRSSRASGTRSCDPRPRRTTRSSGSASGSNGCCSWHATETS
jgi:Tc toxin complex TcA C-terminal TcB-binding domain